MVCLKSTQAGRWLQESISNIYKLFKKLSSSIACLSIKHPLPCHPSPTSTAEGNPFKETDIKDRYRDRKGKQKDCFDKACIKQDEAGYSKAARLARGTSPVHHLPLIQLLERTEVTSWVNNLNRIIYLQDRGHFSHQDFEKLKMLIQKNKANRAHPYLTAAVLAKTKLAVVLRKFQHKKYGYMLKNDARDINSFWRERLLGK